MWNREGCTSKVELLLWNTLRHSLNKDLREPRDAVSGCHGKHWHRWQEQLQRLWDGMQATYLMSNGRGGGWGRGGWGEKQVGRVVREAREAGERSGNYTEPHNTVVRAWLFTLNHIGCKQNATLWRNLKMFTVHRANKLPGGGWQQGDWVWPSFSSAGEVWLGRSLERRRWEELLFWVYLEGRQQNITTWVCEVKTGT